MSIAYRTINGARLRVLHQPGPGRTLVLLHEMGGTIESFDRVAPALAERWSLLRYDQRGAGLSQNVTPPLQLDQQADDLLALLETLGIEGPVALAGAAVGAAVAIRFAARHPHKAAALALLAPATGVLSGRLDAAHERIAILERGEPIRASGPGPAGNAAPILLDPVSYGATWRMLIGLDLDADLRGIACPTLVLAGSLDASRPPEHVAQIAAKIPGARFATLATGHIMALDTPGLVATTLAAFLEDVMPKGPFEE